MKSVMFHAWKHSEGGGTAVVEMPVERTAAGAVILSAPLPEGSAARKIVVAELLRAAREILEIRGVSCTTSSGWTVSLP